MGNRLREVRKQQGLSQFGLAKMCGVEPSNLSKVENGILKPYPGWRQRIALALGVSEEEIFPVEVKNDASNYSG
ncbi:MAG: helix-turn-helix transcriptional regulator [Clostridiales bacterium]|nr:helix-turn-helix transcriptional regulator [Clostridiales bacterium]